MQALIYADFNIHLIQYTNLVINVKFKYWWFYALLLSRWLMIQLLAQDTYIHKGPSINYVVSKSDFFDPLPLLVFFMK